MLSLLSEGGWSWPAPKPTCACVCCAPPDTNTHALALASCRNKSPSATPVCTRVFINCQQLVALSHATREAKVTMMVVMTMVVVTVVCVPLDPLHLCARCNHASARAGQFPEILVPSLHVMSCPHRASQPFQPTNQHPLSCRNNLCTRQSAG
jgi:hypothetical protein